MKRETLEDQVNQGLSTRKIAANFNISQTTVVYWLEKFELTTNKKIEGHRKCPRCENIKPTSEFYNRRNTQGSSTYCKICTNEQDTERHTTFKILAVEYKGGKCVSCGYNKYFGALDFHHVNPKEKEFSLGQYKCFNLNNKVKKELDKCILVCSNCHREIHGGVNKIMVS